MLYVTVDIKTSNPNVSVGLYTLSNQSKVDVDIQKFKQDWLECLADRMDMEGRDGGIMDIAWMMERIQKYEWVLKSKSTYISCVVSV